MKFMVGHNMRYMPFVRTMKEIIDAGVIGTVKTIWCRHFVGNGGPWYFHDWHARRENTTGLLLQKGVHGIDVIHWLASGYTQMVTAFGGLDYFGGTEENDLKCPVCPKRKDCPERQIPTWPDRVQFCAFRKEIDVEDNNMVLMNLDNGVRAAYLQCHFTPDGGRNYTVIGTEGRLENNNEETRVEVWTRRSKGWKTYANRTYHIKPRPGTHGGADPLLARDFVDFVLHGKETVASPIAARMAVAAGCAGTESLRQGGGAVSLPPLEW